jgi:ABC-2 type transport system ATP-binding protein
MKKNKLIIKVTDLSKRFNGLTAVDHISFNVKRGEVFAFLGPNGAGKTTTIRMLTTLLKPTSGQIRINNFNPLTQQDQVRKSFGIVFQDPSLDDELTAWENMEFHGVLYHLSAAVRKKRIKDLLKIIELWDRKNDLVKTFSGGMKRRLEIARGLLHYPKIFFLDEPTIGLDPQTRNKIWEYIKELNKKYNITIFFTTHYMDEAEKAASCIAIIDHGKIISRGTINQIKKQAKAKSLEQAYLKLTGKTIRQEHADQLDQIRARKKMRGR